MLKKKRKGQHNLQHTHTHTEQDSPVLRLDPAGQTLPDVHGEVIIIQIVHMFQESDLQLLNLLPLAHAAKIHTSLYIMS